jgi:adenine-specific DNA-methyltransferase
MDAGIALRLPGVRRAAAEMLDHRDYLFHQLIPYLGNKRKLLPLIRQAVTSTGLHTGSFLDLFSGSGVVSRMAKSAGFRVIANDWEPYSHCINSVCIGLNTAPEFGKLGGISEAFRILNSLAPSRGYIATHYCPADDEAPDLEKERMFYTQENGGRIDAIRDRIAKWREERTIDPAEEATLLASLIYQAAYCSNTSGVFKGFHRGWGGATRTAWYRIRSTLTLSPPLFFDNHQENGAHRLDAKDMASHVSADIAYIDPPYNQHQYGSNYHLLNTVALWDKPPVDRYITRGSKSAIRTDWRLTRRSRYCYESTALPAFQELVSSIDAKFILASYSTDGIMPLRELLEILGRRGGLRVLTRHYKRYRVSSQRPSSRPRTVEFVAVVDTSTPPNPLDIDGCVSSIDECAQRESLALDFVNTK